MTGSGLSEQFDEQRPRLRAVAYRMLGSFSEADDALQDAWLRVQRADAEAVASVPAWLTTVVARVCLNMLRTRQHRREVYVPDPVIEPAGGPDPESEAVLADSVGLALLVVLETLAPAERLAFVLHDMFGVPFTDIAPMIDRTPEAARQLASRGRRRVRGAAPAPDPDLARQRAVVDAFFAAARAGDFDALVAVLDPDVVLRADGGGHPARPSVELRGSDAVAGQARMAAKLGGSLRPVLVNGAAGVVSVVAGKVFSVMAFTVAGDRIVAVEVLYDPVRLKRLLP
jgi:RNA polymerase sigma factor (sigma-70 family)